VREQKRVKTLQGQPGLSRIDTRSSYARSLEFAIKTDSGPDIRPLPIESRIAATRERLLFLARRREVREGHGCRAIPREEEVVGAERHCRAYRLQDREREREREIAIHERVRPEPVVRS